MRNHVEYDWKDYLTPKERKDLKELDAKIVKQQERVESAQTKANQRREHDKLVLLRNTRFRIQNRASVRGRRQPLAA